MFCPWLFSYHHISGVRSSFQMKMPLYIHFLACWAESLWALKFWLLSVCHLFNVHLLGITWKILSQNDSCVNFMGVFVFKAQRFKKLLPSTNKMKIKICGQSRALKSWVNQPSVTSVSLIIYSCIWILLCDCRSLSLMIVFEQQHDSSMHFLYL